MIAKRYLGQVALDLASGVLVQLTTLAAMLAIAWLGGLRETAYFTFALALCGPISLFAGMSLMELIFSGDERYRNTLEIGLAQVLLFVMLALAAGAGVALWNADYILVFAIIACAKLAELVSTFCIHILRREGRFRRLSVVGLLQFVVFCAAAALLHASALFTVQVAFSLGVLCAAVFQAGVSLATLWPEFTGSDRASLHPLRFVRQHVMRSVAISVNSIQSNLPRYGLELLVSPVLQAAYSLLYTLSRLGTLVLQSLFVPIVARFRLAYAAHPLRAQIRAAAGFLAVSALLTLLMAGAWILGLRVPAIRALGARLVDVISVSDGVAILIASGVYLFRFGVWQIVSLLDPGHAQTRFAIYGALVTLIACLLLIPAHGVKGAAWGEAIGNLVLVAIPFAAWTIRRRTTP